MAIAGFAVGHVVGSRSSSEVADTGGTEEAQAADVVVAGDVERYKIPVTDAQPSKGPKDALVTIVEFSEFQCPFCARVLPTTKQVIDTYGEKVRIVWRNNPLGFHNNAAPAAELAMEAYAQGGNDKFWEVHDTLFANQKALGRAELEGYAEKAGLDSAKVKKALDESTHKKAIDGDQGLAAQLGAGGTPYFFINGRQLRGAQPFAAFQKVIDEELATAETLLKQGVKKEQIYATVTKSGLTKAAAPKPQAPKAGQPDPKAVYKVPLKGNEPQKGPDDALVTIVEIQRLRMSILWPRHTNPRRGPGQVRQGRPRRLDEQPASVPQEREGRGERGSRGPRAEGQQGLLGDARQDVREPKGSDHR